jgi:phosphonate transport system substrate-binding protein
VVHGSAGFLLADSARPIYERIAGYLANRLESPVEFLGGVPWEERHRRLDAGEIDVAFICGLPYTRKYDRADRPIELLCAPVMAASRYVGKPIYFTDVIVRRDDPARAFSDLRGRTWAYSNEGSHSGYNTMRHHLLALGETGGYFGRVIASGSHGNSIRMILDGQVDASGIDSTVLAGSRAGNDRTASRTGRSSADIGKSPGKQRERRRDREPQPCPATPPSAPVRVGVGEPEKPRRQDDQDRVPGHDEGCPGATRDAQSAEPGGQQGRGSDHGAHPRQGRQAAHPSDSVLIRHDRPPFA